MFSQSAICNASTALSTGPQSEILEVSVVIASHRPDYIGALLAALLGQSAQTLPYEIIAACDYPVEGLRADFPQIIFLDVNDRSISAKRNAGVRAARAGIVAFIDDDCVPAPDWIASGCAVLAAHPECAAVEGLTTIENSAYAPPSLREYRRLEQPGFRTNNIFYRKDAFVGAGGFDERFTVQREDIDLAFSIIDKGETIRYDTSVRVMHRVRRGEPWDLLKNCVNRRFDPLLYRKHPARYREHIKSPFPRSLLMLLVFHGLFGLCWWIGFPFFIAACCADVAAITVMAVRRSGRTRSVRTFFTEWISCCLAPPALLGALVFGSIRYRKLLLV
jgi:GT2 family glycosyltransferase